MLGSQEFRKKISKLSQYFVISMAQKVEVTLKKNIFSRMEKNRMQNWLLETDLISLETEIIGSLIISLRATSSSSHYLWYRPKTRVLSELIYVLTPLRFLNTWVHKKFYCHDPFKNLLTSGGGFSVWITANGWLKTRDIEGYYGLLAYYVKTFKVTLNLKKRCIWTQGCFQTQQAKCEITMKW